MKDRATWPSRWPAEDAGPRRLATPRSGAGLAIGPGEGLDVVTRPAPIATMVVLRAPGELFLLRHTGGDAAISWVERLDPDTLEMRARSPDLAGGRTWPGGLAAHGNGCLYVVFGRHVYRLTPELEVVARRELPRDRPYNSFVVLPDGSLAMKDFGGALPGAAAPSPGSPCELLVVEPEGLEIIARCELPEASIARLSADGDTIYAVGDQHLLRLRWNGMSLALDQAFRPRYRTLPGQTCGWDAVITPDAAWLLDNGAGADRYAGTFRGRGISQAPLHLVRVDLATGAVALTEICGLPGGIVANPPAIDVARRIAVGYDSGNGVLAAFDFDDQGRTRRRWTRQQSHACHAILFPDTGELVTADHDGDRRMDQIVVLDIESGAERARADTGSPLQSVVFLAPGFGRDLYYCAFPCVSRLRIVQRKEEAGRVG